jgi:pimeloyl-ACP methyl ester carboxylesterase
VPLEGTCLLLTWVLLTACARSVPTPPSTGLPPAQITHASTHDGWDLQLRHFPNEGPPVLLMHGMGTNHYNWDYAEEISLAAYLQSRGWDVWIASMRGDMGSTAPPRRGASTYTFDDIANYDVPAIVESVLAQSPYEQLFWVGHSMGGMLLYTALTRDPTPIAAGVSIASPATFAEQQPVHQVASTASRFIPAYGTTQSRATYAAIDAVFEFNPMVQLLSNPENLDLELAQGLSDVGMGDVSRGMVRQVHVWLSTGDFVTMEGEPWLTPVEVPVLVLAGSVDRVAPQANVTAACKVLPQCEVRILGTQSGLSTEYGHIDLVVGMTARIEVYPQIHHWLKAQAALPPGDGSGVQPL